MCLIASSGYCGYQLVTNLVEFLKFDVETVVEILRDSDADFPTISFCNMQLCNFAGHDFKKYVDIYIQEEYNKTGRTTMEELKKILEKVSIKSLLNSAKEVFLRTHDKSDLEKNNRCDKYINKESHD